MKKNIHKCLSIVMAFVVLVSTMSFTVNMHFCGDTLVETVIFKNAKGCGMEMGKTSTEGCSVVKKNCCKNEQSLVDGQDELQLHVDNISFEQHLFISSLVYSYITLFEGLETNIYSHEVYKPPLVIRQIYKLDETYLI